jgi:alpha/beta superfamily hydrolase
MSGGSFSRSDVSFESAGARCAAWLYRPVGPPPFACVVMGHGFGGTREVRLDAYAERFAAAGFAVLVFDYRHFGASEGEPRQLLDVAKQLGDWRAAIAWARAQTEIDAARVAIWGTSFGGGHVISSARKTRNSRRSWRRCRSAIRARDGAEVADAASRRRRPHRHMEGSARAPAVRDSDRRPAGLAGCAHDSRLDAGLSRAAAARHAVAQRGGRARPVGAAALPACREGRADPQPAAGLRRRPGRARAAGPRHRRRRARAARGREAYPPAFQIYLGALFEQTVADQTAVLAEHLAAKPAPTT